jgi:hypothetical protein
MRYKETVHIGIDDVGSFTATGGRAYIAAAIVRPGRSEEARRLLRAWEKEIPAESKTPGGEVKGHLVPEEALHRFIYEVMLASDPPLRYECAGVDLSPETFAAIEGQQAHTAEQMRAGIEMYRSQGPDFYKIANRYANMLGWWENLSLDQVLHITMLTHVIPTTLNFGIGWSAANGFDDELGDLRFKLDQGFISTSDEKKLFWKDMLRSHLWQATKTGGGLITIEEWEEDHPFLETFIEGDLGDGRVVLAPEFRNRIDFYKSHETFEVRLADVIGSIVRRMAPIPDRFADQHIEGKGERRLIFTGKKVDVPSPYS